MEPFHKTLLYIAFISLFSISVPTLHLVTAQSAADQDFFELTHVETDDGGYTFYATNNHIIPIYVHLAFPQLFGLEADRPVPVEVVLPAGTEEQEIVHLSRNDGNRVSFRSSAQYVRGDPTTVDHDDDHVYLLPFEHGHKYRVTQGYHGSFTHFGQNTNAVDFDMAEGEHVHASRAGRVIEIKQDSNIGGTSARFTKHANYILIQHADGSFGNYVHLQLDGALVEVGEMVAAGQRIGLSGNTGRSSGPHLHFDVRIPTMDGELQSIPVLFMDHQGRSMTVEEGRYYYGLHPDKPGFEVYFGADLTNDDFIDHRASIQSGELDMRIEEIDSTYVLFLQNGTTSRLKVETTLQLRGMNATTPTQLTTVVDPETEVFLSILRPRNDARQIQYGYQFRYQEVD